MYVKPSPGKTGNKERGRGDMKNNWKNILFGVAIFVCIGFVVVAIGNEKNIARADESDNKKHVVTSNEWEDIVNVFEKNKFSMDEWKLYGRKYVKTISNLDGFQTYANELKIKMDQFTWNESIEEDSWSLTGTFINESTKETETIQFITTHTNTNPTTYILFEMQGSDFSFKSPKEIQQQFDQKSANIFQGEYESFACIVGTAGDKINFGLHDLSNSLLTDFNASEVESLKEDTFVSISAYNGKWDRVIPTHHGLINLQIGLRKERLGEKITVVIGTPIITIEY